MDEQRVVDPAKLDRLVGILVGTREVTEGHRRSAFTAILAELFSMSEEERRWYFESRQIPVGGGVR